MHMNPVGEGGLFSFFGYESCLICGCRCGVDGREDLWSVVIISQCSDTFAAGKADLKIH